jgi:hypothetical protein
MLYFILQKNILLVSFLFLVEKMFAHSAFKTKSPSDMPMP